MKFGDFIKDKIAMILLVLFSCFTIEMILIAFDLPLFFLIYIPFSVLIMFGVGEIWQYFQKKKYYETIFFNLEELDQKYLIAEVIPKANFLEGKLLSEILIETNKSMIEHVKYYQYLQENYKEYIELWIHEIKLPIAVSKMIIENNKSSVTRKIDEEIDKIDNYTEQALFYARSNTVEKDYCIKKIRLMDLVTPVIQKNKNVLIPRKIKIDIHDLENEVYTDSKWCVFILNQIIQNSIKYFDKEEKVIEFYSKENQDNIVLSIKDNGIGISSVEISKVFEKGFTGTNGRINDKKSTGIGLYLCKKLCTKLRIGITIASEFGQFTTVNMIFPKGSYYHMR